MLISDNHLGVDVSLVYQLRASYDETANVATGTVTGTINYVNRRITIAHARNDSSEMMSAFYFFLFFLFS